MMNSEGHTLLCIDTRTIYPLSSQQMKILLALDSFKGCLTSEEVEDTFAHALAAQGLETRSFPLSDGGEGMLEAFVAALHGHIVSTSVHDPLMRSIEAPYGITPDGTAIIETARACGLTLLSAEERNPLIATSYGVGELIADALHRGCRRFIIGLGGSGTSDAGRGMLRALVDAFAQGGTMEEVITRDTADCRFTLACDVRNPLYGRNGAAHVFAPQKGATPDMVEELDRRARHFAEESARRLGWDMSSRPGAGAAGGLGYAFMQYFQTDSRSGADLLLDFIGFDEALQGVDLVITGEGHADRQTLMGKLPERVLQRALAHGVPVRLVAGRVDDKDILTAAGFAGVDAITPDGMDTEEAVKPEVARQNIREWVRRKLDPAHLSSQR